MSFLETPRFPDDISYGSTGGPMFNTSIITVDSGHEQANINWEYPKSIFDVSFGVRLRPQLYNLVKFFRAVKGRGHRFRYKDWVDFKSHHGDQIDQAISDTDQIIGIGDGSTEFQLIKEYKEDTLIGTRLIQKPVVGTVVISLDDVPLASGWTCNYTTGVITFTSAPGSSVIVKAGFEFDVPVRFDSDSIETNYEFYNGGSASTNLTEVRIK